LHELGRRAEKVAARLRITEHFGEQRIFGLLRDPGLTAMGGKKRLKFNMPRAQSQLGKNFARIPMSMSGGTLAARSWRK